ncbi:MAG: hypothetical protein EBZ48_10230, partial [Proteobacteria bacterium]|nr:hypothetical protein [Pseudomonadota bacterium]
MKRIVSKRNLNYATPAALNWGVMAPGEASDWHELLAMSTSLKFEQSRVESSTEQLVVQCPACMTRFGVERAEVAAYRSPRFHCSRCDNVFAAGAAGVTPTGVQGSGHAGGQSSAHASVRTQGATRMAPLTTALTPEPQHTPTLLRSITKSVSRETPSDSMRPSSSERPSLPPSAFDDPNFTEGVVAVYRNSSRIRPPAHRMSEPSPTLEIPKSWDGSVRAAAPRETSVGEASVDSYPSSAQIGFDFDSQPDSRWPAAKQVTPSVTESIEVKNFGTVVNAPLLDSTDSTQPSSHGIAQAESAPSAYDVSYQPGPGTTAPS